jgi:hypothetical protein
MREHLALAIEDFIVGLIDGIVRLPLRACAACREVGRLFDESFSGAPGGRSAFEAELAELIAPHLAVLVHKRTRMFVADDEGAAERWRLELRCFIDCAVLPIMGDARVYAERNLGLVAEILDAAIARAQNAPALPIRPALLPSVTPFGSSWAT